METEVARDLERGSCPTPGPISAFGTGRGMACPTGPLWAVEFSEGEAGSPMGDHGEPPAGICKWDGAPEARELAEEGREATRLGWERRGWGGTSTASRESGPEAGGRKRWAARFCWWVKAMATFVVAAAVCKGAWTRGSQMTDLPLSSRPAITDGSSWMSWAMSWSCFTICWMISVLRLPELCSALFRSKMEFCFPATEMGEYKTEGGWEESPIRG